MLGSRRKFPLSCGVLQRQWGARDHSWPSRIPDVGDLKGERYPTPGVFGQRVRNRLKRKELNFAVCKRVRKNVKRKNLNEMRVLVGATAQTFPKWEEYPAHPGVFVRVANAGLTGYGTWKSVRRTGC